MNQIAKLLSPGNVVVDLEASSKKRVFEQAGLLFENNQGIARAVVFDALLARERLGSTGLGQGIPEAATEQHLQILSELAQMFSDRAFRESLAAADDAAAAHRLLTTWQGNAAAADRRSSV